MSRELNPDCHLMFSQFLMNERPLHVSLFTYTNMNSFFLFL